MGYKSIESENYLLGSNPETRLNIQKQKDVLVSMVKPIIDEGINDGFIKPNDTLSPHPEHINGWVYSKTPATYEILNPIDEKTNQPIVFMLVRYGKKIGNVDGEIVVEEFQMKISVSGDNLVLIKNYDTNNPLYVPMNVEKTKDDIFKAFEDKNAF
jgi:hypothetical protein